MAEIIDTSVIVDLERRGWTLDNVLNALWNIPSGGQERRAISAITVSELLVGVHLSIPETRRARRSEFVEAILTALDIIPFDILIARTHSLLVVDLRRRGLPTGANDLLIAATALTLGYSLLTYNASHFENIPGLIVRQPNW